MPRVNRTEQRIRLLGVIVRDVDRWWDRPGLGDELCDWIHNDALLGLVKHGLLDIDRSRRMYRYRITDLGVEKYKEWLGRGPIEHGQKRRG